MDNMCTGHVPWYTAPVIIGGSGGSGTRGVSMMLQEFGIAIACTSKDFMLPGTDCDLKCNSAADCGLLSSFRTGKAVGGHGVLSWLRSNVSGTPAFSCNAMNEAAFEDAMTRSADVCGGSKRAAVARLQSVIAPAHRRPLRWGFKNPHATYYVNALRKVFPCMVFINTVRDLDVMVRTAKHFDARVQEAVRYGVMRDDAAVHVHRSLEASQRFYGNFLRHVNDGLHHYLVACMPHRFAHVPLQRLIVRGANEASPDDASSSAAAVHAKSRRTSCVDSVLSPLLKALHLPHTPRIVNVTRHFLAASLPTVRHSVAEAMKAPLLLPHGDDAITWPPSLEVDACRGPLMVSAA